METFSKLCQPANGSMPVPFSYGLSSAPRFSTVTAAFHHHVAARPHEVAARDLSVTPPSEISYGDLARRSSRLAQKLQSLGVAPGDRVPLVVKRGIDMLVGIIAVLSCRAQYVPLDGSVVPDATLRFVLQQTQSRIVLALKATRHRFSEMGESSVVTIDDFEDEKADESSELDLPQAVPGDGCYVIYTSGTTGTPKGVDVTHQNVTNLVCQSPGDLGIKPGTRVGQVLSISFDMAAWEMLGCLCNGGTLVLRGSDWKKAVKEVDVLICTPSILTKFRPEENGNIKVVATAGEPSSQLLADTWASGCTYYNCCGPTETTIVNTMHDHKPNTPLSIGKPTPNNNVYILDEDNKPVKIGEPGVMWAGGLGVTRGYVELPEKTAEKYILDPFKGDGSKMYNTGDLCKWNTDGSVQILGRIDDQVKVKGFRIELDGVAASLSACPTVQRATALLIDGEIHGFLTPKTCDLEKVAEDFKGRQPYYAIPSQFHLLDAFPLTGNGKIDKKALKAIEFQSRQTAASEKTSTDIITYPKDVFFSHTGADSSTSSMTNVLTASKTMASSVESLPDLEKGIPDKQLGKRARGLRHRVLIVYRRLFTLVGILNIAAAIAVIFTGFPREWLGTITAINLAVAVLIRQDFVINALYTVTCSVPKSWPMFIRSRCAKIIHLGGVHSGAAVSAGIWLFASNVGDVVCMNSKCGAVWGHQSVPAQVISWILTALFCVMLVMAYPTMRKSHHDLFEKTHRFVGWTMLGLFWAQVVLTSNDTKASDMSLGNACVRSPSFWLLLVASCSVACSWLFLKKVPVQSEVLSEHAIRLHFDFAVPVNGTFTRLSKKPLLEWHSFATIPAPEPENGRPVGHSLVVSNAGDWTKSTIQEAPTHIWTRGVPTCGVMRIATLFNRVVLIATGSGIGPCLGHIQNPSCPTQLIWSTSRPETTFGTGLCDTIRSKVPNAVIHDTKKLGRPDLVKMGYNLAKSFNAEAVIIIANEKITKKVVYGLETRGVPAYGAIWDS